MDTMYVLDVFREDIKTSNIWYMVMVTTSYNLKQTIIQIELEYVLRIMWHHYRVHSPIL